MPRSHAPFAVLNRTLNPLVAVVLRSPLHRSISSRLALITVTGRRSGRSRTFPVGYRRDGDRVTIQVGSPERKRWWRNLRGGAPVTLRLQGREWRGQAETHSDERNGVTVEVRLNAR